MDSDDSSASVVLPLADGSGDELPLRFAFASEADQKWDIVEKYLDIRRGECFPKAGVNCCVALLRREAAHPLVEEMLRQFVERGQKTFKHELEADRADRKRKRAEEAAAAEVKRQRKLSEDTNGGVDQRRAHGLPGKQEPDSDEVSDKFPVRLPSSARSGQRCTCKMPEGCTDRDVLSFVVPKGSYAGDEITLTAKFRIKGHCIQALMEVTGLSREDAIQRLTPAHGDGNFAAQRYFETLGGNS
jgi:hypothetical protein